jgi:hypothetical protein
MIVGSFHGVDERRPAMAGQRAAAYNRLTVVAERDHPTMCIHAFLQLGLRC